MIRASIISIALEDRPQDHARKRRQEVLIEHEVAERVGNRHAEVRLDFPAARAGANREPPRWAPASTAACASSTGELTGDVGELEAAVDLDDHEIGARADGDP